MGSILMPDILPEVKALVLKIVDSDLLSLYAGPCGANPITDSCAKKGIRSINGVVPNEDGHIYLLFDKRMDVFIIEEPSLHDVGVAINMEFGLEQLCAAKNFLGINPDGTFTNEPPVGGSTPGPTPALCECGSDSVVFQKLILSSPC